MPSETHGDHYNVTCPHCMENNTYVSDGVVGGVITRFQKACFHCGKIIFYHARHEIIVTAYAENPF